MHFSEPVGPWGRQVSGRVTKVMMRSSLVIRLRYAPYVENLVIAAQPENNQLEEGLFAVPLLR